MLIKFIKIANLLWKGKNVKRYHILFSDIKTQIAVKIIFSLCEPRMPGEEKACFLNRSFISFWENGNISEFLLIFLSYLIKKEKMNHEISCMPFLHERKEQKSHVALLRESPLLWFSRWSPALQQLDSLRWKSLEAERDTDSRGWGGREGEGEGTSRKVGKEHFSFQFIGI